MYDASTGNNVFHGIPYASPPISSLRFKPPIPTKKWFPQNLKILQFGPSCIQYFDPTIIPSTISNTSEDCLYLNIWAPRNPNQPLAVMI